MGTALASLPKATSPVTGFKTALARRSWATVRPAASSPVGPLARLYPVGSLSRRTSPEGPLAPAKAGERDRVRGCWSKRAARGGALAPSPQPSPRCAGRGGRKQTPPAQSQEPRPARSSPMVRPAPSSPMVRPAASSPMVRPARSSVVGPLAPAKAGERDRVRGCWSKRVARGVSRDPSPQPSPRCAGRGGRKQSPPAQSQERRPARRSSPTVRPARSSPVGPLAPAKAGERDRVRGGASSLPSHSLA
jgi:hypothetical protein